MLSRLWIFASLLLALCGCGQQSETVYTPTFTDKSNDVRKEYVVGIHPLHNPQRLMEVYGPIVEYINLRMPEIRLHLEASHDYADFNQKLDAGHFDFAMPNPYQTIRAIKRGYHVFGKMGDDDMFRGIILIRKDSDIKTVADLKGKAVAYPAETALAATMMTQYYLHTHGLNINKDIQNRYVGSQESSILNVLRKHVAAGATWPVPWIAFSTEHPEMASELEIKWETAPLKNNAWVVRDDVPPAIAEQFKVLLFSLNDTEEGRRMLERLPISRFELANNQTYDPVVDFLKVFSKEVRPVNW